MVNIHRHELAAAASDEQALELFRRQWAIYQKMIDHNYLNHVEVYQILHCQLVDDVEGPFRILDLACGDAAAMVGALTGDAGRALSRRRSGGAGPRAGPTQPRRPGVRRRARAA